MALIAIVEDEALIALDIEKSLKRAGYSVAGPFDSATGYLAAIGQAVIDLALMDITIKGPMNGIEATRQSLLRGGPPSVFITALSDNRILADTKTAEPLGILVKPFSERELLGTVDIALFRAGMENRLRHSEKRYRGLFDFSLSPRCIVDGQGRIVESNAAFLKLFGADVTDKNMALLFAEPNEWGRIKTAVLQGTSLQSKELSMKDASGGDLTVLGAFSGIRDSLSGNSMLSAELFDLTESKRLRDELHQAQKMESMGRLAGGIAHDFNNILTAIVGHAEMLKLDVEPSSAAYEDVEGIARTAERATQLTKQLLGFSRKQAFSPKLVGVCSIVSDASKLLKRLAGESVLFSIFLPGEDPKVFADPMQIEQALINLVVNARDALEGRSDARISIVVGKRILEEKLSIRSTTLGPGTYATIEVADNGIGMSKNVAEKVFEPFFTTKVMGKGTGLGLAIASSIAVQTRGAIDLQTEEGKGTIFTLWIPVHASALEEEAAGAIPPLAASPNLAAASLVLASHPDILIVDDDESLLGFLSYVLARAGATVSSARNAGEALLMAENRTFEVLVADINLPGLNGISLYERLSGKMPLRCVFITGRPEENTKIPARTQLLEKPFTPMDLVAAIRTALASP